MRRVLIVSPHFPPDTGAASHRYRLLAPNLQDHGWCATLVCVDWRDIGARAELGLNALVHAPVETVRVRALGGRRGRFVGIGDLGLRALPALQRTCTQLLSQRKFDIVLLTVPPHYTALLGPALRWRTGVPYVLDYQDPWVSAWGDSVGPGPSGKPDWRSRLSRRLAMQLEPFVARRAAGFAAVSQGTLAGLIERNPNLGALPRSEIPLGGDSRDFEVLRSRIRASPCFTPHDRQLHIVSVGTLAPLGLVVLRGIFRAAARALARESERCLRFHFFGTSGQTRGGQVKRIIALAREEGVDDCVIEHPLRIDYAQNLAVLCQASAILLPGSTEPHYTASRVFPAILANRPILAVYHVESTACRILLEAGAAGCVNLVTFDSANGPLGAVDRIAQSLESMLARHRAGVSERAITPLAPCAGVGRWSAKELAGDLAGLLESSLKPDAANAQCT